MIFFDTLFDEYQRLITLRGYKTGGGKMYGSAVLEFFSFLRQRGYAHFEVHTKDMFAYYEYLTTRPNQRREGTLSESTINHHLFALHLLFDYLLETGYCDALPLLPKYLRTHQEPKGILSVLEMTAMYEVCTNLQETALLSSAYGLGLRRTEIESLKLSDLDLQAGNVIIRTGKGGKRREVPMSDKVIRDLRAYIHTERSMRSHRVYHLFTAKQGGRLSGYAMNEIVKQISKRVPGLQGQNITLHTLRRSIATHLAENGASMYFIKDFLGHSHIDTAQLYAIRRKRRHHLS